ncbi:MAG: hypothetical protein COW59_04595 [Lysobacterales bacterium CG17_big_fil_post_rev_8_21_14_2_50_64_11]|nr:MAG: hypothetical protein COW59_04595 [Xanthomonadales bacterium CG17_big_fil_post_rev_8_21_14_2_50_64_11]
MNAVTPCEFPESLQWLNAPAQSLADARGRVVLIAVVCAGSGWSQNLIDDVRRVQARHPEHVRAFVVHCPKFDAERDPRVLGKWINRLGIGLPVASDLEFALWQQFDLQAWPSLVVLDIDGSVHEVVIGDGRGEPIEACVSELLNQHDDLLLIGEAPIFSRSEPPLPLRFPTGLAVTAEHLYVVDSGHHRVLECTFAGRIMRQFGSGNADLLDGRSGEAALRRPMAVVVLREALYVIDSGNHALRKISLHDGDIETVLGTGRPGASSGGSCRDGERHALDLPLGLCAQNQCLYIANSAANQVLVLDLGARELSVLAGSGELGRYDAKGTAAILAQPAGIAVLGQKVFFTDAGVSSIRSIQIENHAVTTLFGADLYDFGDVDGGRDSARLQYPTAIASDAEHGLLWIVDTYNNALRRLPVGSAELTRLPVSVRLHQPMGIAVGAGSLWLANTDAHEVLRIDPQTGEAVHVPIGE